MINKFKENLPRLFELYEQNMQKGSEDYFNIIRQRINESQLAFNCFKNIEIDLQALDDIAWIDLKDKISSEDITPDKINGYYKVLSILYEAKGYVYLKDKGCEKINFIQRRENIKMPDLIANGNQKILLEVKVIIQSINEKKYLLTNTDLLEKGEVPQVRRLRPHFPPALQYKLTKTLKTATTQLDAYECVEPFLKIVFFVIHLDYEQGITRDIKQKIKNFLHSTKKPHIEIECFFM